MLGAALSNATMIGPQYAAVLNLTKLDSASLQLAVEALDGLAGTVVHEVPVWATGSSTSYGGVNDAAGSFNAAAAAMGLQNVKGTDRSRWLSTVPRSGVCSLRTNLDSFLRNSSCVAAGSDRNSTEAMLALLGGVLSDETIQSIRADNSIQLERSFDLTVPGRRDAKSPQSGCGDLPNLHVQVADPGEMLTALVLSRYAGVDVPQSDPV